MEIKIYVSPVDMVSLQLDCTSMPRRDTGIFVYEFKNEPETLAIEGVEDSLAVLVKDLGEKQVCLYKNIYIWNIYVCMCVYVWAQGACA